ncbi:MAG TPA: xanthine dehydrogenase family protein subunit M [Syntrophorhabdaceae bacterium]|nr:xanthine dehydrogenase family protein subunit M [Syntrophorhabdaceae bacterium]
MIHDFTYLKPGSVKEALSMLAEHDDCKIVCGGQSLLIPMRQGLLVTEYLIDIKGLNELSYIKYDAKEGLKLGATTTHRMIEKSDVIKKNYPVLVEMEDRLASTQTRNWGTIGGNLAHGDAAGDPAPVLITLGAKVKVASAKGERVIPLEEFYTDIFESVMEHEEMIIEVQVPPMAAKSGAAYTKFNLLRNDMGVVGVGASITLDGNGACKEAIIALGNAAVTPIRAKNAEKVLVGKKLTDALFAEAGEAAGQECDPVSDIHASEDYRRHLVKVLTKRMAKKAFEQASK